MHEALRQHQQAGARRDDQHRRERHSTPGSHHRSSHRGLGVVALGDLLAESAHHEQPVVDGDTQADQRDYRLGEEVHRPEHGDQPQDAQRARDAQATHDGRQAGGDRTAEHQEQDHRDQRHREDLHAALVGGDGAGQGVGDRFEAGQLHRAAVELLQIRLDGLVVIEDAVVVVALQRDADEGVLLVLADHPLDQWGSVGGIGHRQPAGPADDLVGMVGLELVQLADDLLPPRWIVDSFSVRSGEGGHHVAGAVAAVGLVAQHRGLHGLAAVVVEAALCNMLAQAHSEDPAEQTQSYRDPDHDVPVSVHSSTPPGEHASSLLDR